MDGPRTFSTNDFLFEGLEERIADRRCQILSDEAAP
jgi:hypothetical protein